MKKECLRRLETQGILVIGARETKAHPQHTVLRMNLSVKQKQNHGRREQTGGCQGGGAWGRDGVRG